MSSSSERETEAVLPNTFGFVECQTTVCVEYFHILFSNSDAHLVQRSVLGTRMRRFEQYLPMLIALLYFATGDYLSFVRHLQFLLRI